jgi:glycerophosphoryl diester phosphodiesterase
VLLNADDRADRHTLGPVNLRVGHPIATSIGHGATMAVALAARHFIPANPFLAPKARPLIVGHRGVPALHQENTLAGFRRALALGIDAIELDVRLTRDGRAVVFHDANAERLTGVRRAISDLTWDEVSRLRVQPTLGRGSHATHYGRVERIPLLAEVLAELGHSIAINIELKPRWFGDDVAAVVAVEVARAGVAHRVLVTSYDPRKLRDTHGADPTLALGYCWNSSPFAGMFGGGRRIVDRLLAGTPLVRCVGADHSLVHGDTFHRLRGAGLAVGAHVVFPLGGRPTPPAEVARLVALGVDWIESDDPGRLQQLVC